MRDKIRKSLSIKVFLWVFLALTICSMLLYGLVLTVLPRQYQYMSNQQLQANAEILAAKLADMRYEDAVEEINNFCIQNNVAALLRDEKETLKFGGIDADDSIAATFSVATVINVLDSKTEYMLVVSSISQTADHIFSLLLRILPIALAVIFILSLISAVICSKAIVSPIVRISEISKRMASLDMNWKCDIKREDEIGTLAASLNVMSGCLNKTMNELEHANLQLTADVKKFQKLERQRNNFFAAASHELKTPLTVLKGQLENMILGYGDYQDHEKYLPQALEAAERLEGLVTEIITISKTEHMDIQNALEHVSVIASIDNALKSVLPLAEQKGIEIVQNMETDIVLSVNINLWEKALSNILGNAVLHSPYGAKVFIFLREDQDGLELVVENTGAFIENQDISHLFAPFFRADKSRSKATGGSGLGLYIVKTILDLHHIKYCLKNTDHSVAFFLYLNQKQ